MEITKKLLKMYLLKYQVQLRILIQTFILKVEKKSFNIVLINMVKKT